MQTTQCFRSVLENVADWWKQGGREGNGGYKGCGGTRGERRGAYGNRGEGGGHQIVYGIHKGQHGGFTVVFNVAAMGKSPRKQETDAENNVGLVTRDLRFWKLWEGGQL